MRYAQGGGLTAEGRRRRQQVRVEAARRFVRRVPAAVIAAELRVSERSVRRWRQAWQADGLAGLASRGQAAQCWLDEEQLAALDVALGAGPLAAGWTDQRWTLARVRDLVAAKLKEQYTVPGIWYLLRRRGWTCQIGARRAIERDDGAVEVWKKQTWPRIKAPRRPSARLGRRAGLLPAGPPQPADLPAAPLPRPQGRDQGVHLDRVPGPAPCRAPPAARRGHRAHLG